MLPAMEEILNRLALPGSDLPSLLAELVAQLRPGDASDFESARRNLQALCHILSTHPGLRSALRNGLTTLAQSYRHSELYTATGILPNTSFIAEALHRVGHTLLPEVLDPDLLRSVLRRAFDRPGDRHWVSGVGEQAWVEVLEAIHFDEEQPATSLPTSVMEILRSLRILSHWVAACGMEPELLRLERSLETHDSPFAAQSREMDDYIAAFSENWGQPPASDADDRHLRVLFDQCQDVIEKVRRNAARNGTSVRLTYHLRRVRQLLRRCAQLLDILAALQADPKGGAAYPAIAALFVQLVREECLRNNLPRHWRQSIELIAIRVTDHTSHHGEHYITETRAEYWQLCRSAMIGGFVIAFMACLKILLAKAQMPPLPGAICYCLNYGLGFCLIHILHGTVATKQPAMTANAIAASISEAGGKLRDIGALTTLIARTCRSQIVAILGNVCVAIPLAALIALAIFVISGEHFTSEEKSLHLLAEQSPLHSGALVYAAIAGICLFIAGLLSGYYDNYAAYNRIAERILQLHWPRRLFGEARMRRVAAYLGDNLGALAGNLLFGFLLGGTTLFGQLFGLPIDIRHVAFSSAFVGIAFVDLDCSPDVSLFIGAVVGVAAIGFMNLAVSFALALSVALRARQVAEAAWRNLARAVLAHLVRQPRDFFLPPRRSD